MFVRASLRAMRRHRPLACARLLADASASEAVVHAAPAAVADSSAMSQLGAHETLLHGLKKAGVTELFPVQRETFDLGVQGRDMFVRSRTGSGKTLGFAMPIVDGILRARDGTSSSALPKRPSALILTPTRELAKQVAGEFARVAPLVRVTTLYGGTSRGPQCEQLRRGTDVVVATPGRCMDLMNERVLSLDSVRFAVLDEADEMLRMGFAEDVEEIFGNLPAKEDRWTSMWSATKPDWVERSAASFLSDPKVVDLVGQNAPRLPDTIRHVAVMVNQKNRTQALAVVLAEHMNLDDSDAAEDEKLADGKKPTAIIFTKTKRECNEIARSPMLRALGPTPLNGDLSQEARDDAMKAFRDGRCRLLVATDVAARGIDVPHIQCVIHYNLPEEQETFVHRSGRTGRAGRSGTNIMLCNVGEFNAVRQLMNKYDFEAEQSSLPSMERLVNVVGKATAKELKLVDPKVVKNFKGFANQLIESMGAEEALAAALAELCPLPLDADFHSAIDGEKNMASMLIKGDRLNSVEKAYKALEDLLAAEEVQVRNFRDRSRNEYLFEGGVVMDFPASIAHKLLGAMEKSQEGGIVGPITDLSVAQVLPKVYRDKKHRVNRNYSGPAWRANSDGGRSRNGGRRQNDRYAAGRNDRSNRRGGRGDFDDYAFGGRGGGRYEPGGYGNRGRGNYGRDYGRDNGRDYSQDQRYGRRDGRRNYDDEGFGDSGRGRGGRRNRFLDDRFLDDL